MNRIKHSVLLLEKMRVERTYTGGRLLDEWQGVSPARDGLHPEEWVASTTPSRFAPDPTTGLSRIRNEDLKGSLLRDYISQDPAGILGVNHYQKFGENLGFLTKIIDSDKRLNIQTHPDRIQAKILFDSDYGKSEAWYVMGGRIIDEEEPYILMGFKPGMTREKWIDMVNHQKIQAMEESLHKVTVQQGDVFLIPSGMPHAIGSGCMIAEIQEPTDITFRVEKISHPGKSYPEETYHQGVGYAKMFDCFDYTSYSSEKILEKTKICHSSIPADVNAIQTPVINREDIPFFSMDEIALENSGKWTLNNRSGFATAVVLEGKGSISHRSNSFELNKSDEIFLPCSYDSYILSTNSDSILKILVCYPPDRQD